VKQAHLAIRSSRHEHAVMHLHDVGKLDSAVFGLHLWCTRGGEVKHGVPGRDRLVQGHECIRLNTVQVKHALRVDGCEERRTGHHGGV